MRRDLSLQPPRDSSSEMTAFVVQLNQRLDQIADMFYRIGELSGDTLRLTGNLDLGGKRVMNVGATRTDNDAPSRGELRRKSLYIDATGRLRSNAPIEANGGIEVPRALQQTDAISLGQIQETIAAAIAVILATVAPPKVADASAVGTATKVARQDHTHEGVNLDDAQVIVGAKTFDLDPAAPFVVTAGSAAVTNLDADLLDGQHASDFVSASLVLSGAVDPSAGAGVAANPGALYLRNGAGAPPGELWLKTDIADTDWAFVLHA